MQITVDYVNPPKEGKRNGSVKAGSTLYSYNPAEITFAKGCTYEVEAVQSEQNPKLYFVNKAKPVNGAQSPMPGLTPERYAGPTTPQSDRFWLPFVSNTVAHALSSGLIKEPYQVKTWAAAAKQAALELDGQRQPGDDFDDGMPL